jgi:hypothetical protein
MEAAFSINLYDHEGDQFEKGIYIHSDKYILKFNDLKELIEYKNQLDKIIKEIMDSNLFKQEEI